MTLRLPRPTLELYDAWRAAVTGFVGGHIDGSGLPDGARPDRGTLRSLITKHREQSDVTRPLPLQDVRDRPEHGHGRVRRCWITLS